MSLGKNVYIFKMITDTQDSKDEMTADPATSDRISWSEQYWQRMVNLVKPDVWRTMGSVVNRVKTFQMHVVICSSHLCDSGSEDDDCSPETKAERERMRRQANNARER